MFQKMIVLLTFTLVFVPIQLHCESKTEIRVGVIAPLTGGLAQRGTDIERTISLLSPVLNERSKKYRYKFLIDDGKCGVGNTPSTLAHKFINVDHVKFMITACSGETLQAGPIAQRNKIVNFAVLSMHQDIKNLGNYIFRTYVDVERGLQLIPQLLDQRKIKKIALFTEENAFTEGIKRLLIPQLEERLVFAEDFSPDTGDFRSLILKARAKNPGAYYLNCAAGKTFATLVTQLKQMGITEPIYTYHMPEDPEVVAILGDKLEGTVYMYHPDINDASQGFREFIRKYKEEFPEGPSMEFLVRSTYDAIISMTDSVEKVGPDPEEIESYLYQYRKHGALGIVSFDKNGDVKGVNYVLKQIIKGLPTTLAG